MEHTARARNRERHLPLVIALAIIAFALSIAAGAYVISQEAAITERVEVVERDRPGNRPCRELGLRHPECERQARRILAACASDARCRNEIVEAVIREGLIAIDLTPGGDAPQTPQASEQTSPAPPSARREPRSSRPAPEPDPAPGPPPPLEQILGPVLELAP